MLLGGQLTGRAYHFVFAFPTLTKPSTVLGKGYS